MKKSISAIILTAVIFAAVPANAFKLKLKKTSKPRINYTSWVASKDFPKNEDGIKLFYPQTTASDSSAIITGTLPAKGLTDEQVMLAAMIYAYENLDSERQERITETDLPRKKFSFILSTTTGTNNREATYNRIVTIRGGKGTIDFTVSDIDVRYRQKGLIPRTVDIETLHPESDTRHEELILELVSINSEFLNKLSEYVASRKDLKVTHHNEIQQGTVVNGMNPDEVILSIGTPRDTRHSGERTRWIYDNETVIVFTGGKVTKVIGL